jgi:two-component system cell cycle response regulator DivK
MRDEGIVGQAAAVAAGAGAGAGARTALIVEDNEMNLKLARDLLRHGGFRTIEATRGTDGVDLAKLHHPDVVIMDIQLPDFDGWEALRRLRADPATADLVVVAVTAFAISGDRERFLDGGFDGYVAKPLDVKTFSNVVGGYCDGLG